MKILVIGNEERYRKFLPQDLDILNHFEVVFCPLGTSNEDILRVAADADGIAADAIATVDKQLIEQMPNLKIIHSEGVAYNGFDIEAARQRGIRVCNCKGINAGAVAEQAILLMLALLRHFPEGEQAEKEGKQIQFKEHIMVHGMSELSDQKIGFIGFGDIAKATAKRLYPFDCEMYYYTKSRKSKELEDEYHVSYMDLDTMAKECDMISIHVPVNAETTGMINENFISKMKSSAYIINTARGEIVDNQALREALIEGKIAGAGLDTIAPEPTTKDNPLIALPEEVQKRVVYSPHIGGVSTSTFKRGHRMIWKAFFDIEEGKEPNNIVNNICNK